MPTVVLGHGSRAGRDVVVPGRVRVELAELVELARQGGHRLPFDVSSIGTALVGDGAPAGRSWLARLSPEPQAAPPDALARLLAEQAARARRSAADPDRAAVRDAMVEAVGVLAGAEAVVDVELGARLEDGPPTQARAWVGVRGETAASLATVTGAELELAWGATAALPEILAHLVRLPDPPGRPEPEIPSAFTVPVEVLAASGLGPAQHRDDLLPALVARFPGAVTGPDGEPYDARAALVLVRTLVERLTARLRVVVPGRHGDAAGAVVWMRVGSRWLSMRPDVVAGVPVARARAVVPRDLAREVGPVLARVWGRDGQG
ncbi:hypothetical protein ACJ5H2_04865 [Nocardioides sp. R1-1]|uniref:hypothetical protein n=1 Tax=Nocardioides sp. R1-1 TaxID=3383502 RepID=UPI0038D06AAA